MQAVKYKDTIEQNLEWPALAICNLQHKVSATTAEMTYTGPKIDYAEWHRMMSFFRWTYQQCKSESQVRGFVDLKDNLIRLWAFPQEANTGMTSKEITGTEFDKQRNELPNASDLIYFMTVHHHCACSAFQSGGDSANEERPGGHGHETGQDGLHITMGNMDKDRHDIDVRFYLRGVKLVPNLADFWNIGKELAAMVPRELHDRIARHQMCEKVDLEFPEQWKKNYMENKPSITTYRSGNAGYWTNLGYGGGSTDYKPLHERIEECADGLIDEIVEKMHVNPDDVVNVMEFLAESAIMEAILTTSTHERFDAIDIRNLIKDMRDFADSYKDSLVEEIAGVDKSVNKKKNRKRNKSKRNEQHQHGERNPENTAYWDADQQNWVNH